VREPDGQGEDVGRETLTDHTFGFVGVCGARDAATEGARRGGGAFVLVFKGGREGGREDVGWAGPTQVHGAELVKGQVREAVVPQGVGRPGVELRVVRKDEGVIGGKDPQTMGKMGLGNADVVMLHPGMEERQEGGGGGVLLVEAEGGGRGGCGQGGGGDKAQEEEGEEAHACTVLRTVDEGRLSCEESWRVRRKEEEAWLGGRVVLPPLQARGGA